MIYNKNVDILIRFVYALFTHLSDGSSEQVDDSLVRNGDHALPVDLDDAVSDAHAASLGDPASKKAAYL